MSDALVVYSGGQDSTTCLHWALKQFSRVEAVFFDYSQRHACEKEAAQKICNIQGIPLKIFNIPFFTELGGNSLVDSSLTIETKPGELPNTFVPGRNLIFLTNAAAYAYTKKIKHLVTGVCQTDYSGYPDCRRDTLDALETALSKGMEWNVSIHTPLMYKTKADTVTMAKNLGALDSLKWSHTCYEGTYPPCGKCPSCQLREKGFREAGIPDPIHNRNPK